MRCNRQGPAVTLLPRLAWVAGISSLLGMIAEPARAALIFARPSPGTLQVTSTASDSITITCKGGLVFVNGANAIANAQTVPCSAIAHLQVFGGPGPNTIQLYGMYRADYTALAVIEVSGSNGNDVIVGTDIVSGLTELLAGDAGDDTIFGGDGNDALAGGVGQDVLKGGPGNDQLTGGNGDDTYRFAADDGGIDTIGEFPGLGTNDQAVFSSAGSGDYTVSPGGVKRGTNELKFQRYCSGGSQNGNLCNGNPDCPGGGFCTSYTERMTVLGDSPTKPSDADRYIVAPSRDTIFTITDLGLAGANDQLIYDVGSVQPVCPIIQGGVIVESHPELTTRPVKPVYFSGIEQPQIKLYDCQNKHCTNAPTLVCAVDGNCTEPGVCAGPGNGAPDGCELLMGTVQDCDPDGPLGGQEANGIPDVCEPEDCDGDGLNDACEVDQDADGVKDDCDNCDPRVYCTLDADLCANGNQLDYDGDGVGDVCDNCVHFCNPDQTDTNNNGVGDACEVTIGGEYQPPPSPGLAEGCDPNAIVPCLCQSYASARVIATAAATLGNCVGGPNDGLPCYSVDDCPGQGALCNRVTPPAITPPQGAFFYRFVHNDQGALFAREKRPTGQPLEVSIQWKNQAGQNVGNVVHYFVNDQLPPVQSASPEGLPYDVDRVDAFRNVIRDLGYAPVIRTTLTPLVIYNGDVKQYRPASVTPDFFLCAFTPCTTPIVQLSANAASDAYVSVLWTDGPGGTLQGLEVVHLSQVPVPAARTEFVGRKLEIPAIADCRSDYLANAEVSGVRAAFERRERTLDIWPIRPETSAANFQVIWFRTTTVGHCWPAVWTRHTADWPPDPQNFVVDSTNSPDPPLVDMPIGENPPDYCDAVLAHSAPAPGSGLNPFAEITPERRFRMRNPGFAVVRLSKKIDEPGYTCSDPAFPGFEGSPLRASVHFEVIRAYTKTDPAVSLGVQNWSIGTALGDPSHDLDTRLWPYGYLHSGRPFAPCIYDDSLPGCIPALQEKTGQIFPVNSGDVHGSLEAWWFQEGRFAPGVFWPHKRGVYTPVWPAVGDPEDDNPNDDPIVIASRIGAGSYPDNAETTIYELGTFPNRVTEWSTLDGWNPNDEHAILLSRGNAKRAYAARDDNPWNSNSGHPYVIVQYRDAPPPIAGDTPVPWAMGVQKVLGESGPDTFDYTRFAFEPAENCGCEERLDAGAFCSDIDPSCECDTRDVSCACTFSNPQCNCGDPNLQRACVGGGNNGASCTVNAQCTGGGQCVSVDPRCLCNVRRCVNGASEGRSCTTVDDCDCNNEPVVSGGSCERAVNGVITLFPNEPCDQQSDCCSAGEFDCRCALTRESPGVCQTDSTAGGACFDEEDCVTAGRCTLAQPVCDGGRQGECNGGSRNGLACATNSDCPKGFCENAGNTCADKDDCVRSICVGSANTNQPCASNAECGCSASNSVPVVAGLPLVPLFPVNFGGVAPCETGSPPTPQTVVTTVCVGGANDGRLCTIPGNCPGGICTDDGVWVDRTGVIWAAEGYDDLGAPQQWCVGGPRNTLSCTSDAQCRANQFDELSVCRGAGAAILLYENWPHDGGCQPWRSFACVGGSNDGRPCRVNGDCPAGACNTTRPYPLIYRPGWPSTECAWPDEPTCPRPVEIGETIVDQTEQCGAIRVLHDSAGVQLLDTTHEVFVSGVTLPPEVDFANLPPHLFGGTIGGSLPFPDRIWIDGDRLYFRGIMSDRDLEQLRLLSENAAYRTKLAALQTLTHQQLTTPLANPLEKFVSAARPSIKPGWVVLAFQNDNTCASVGSPTVQVWNVACGPEAGRVRVLVPSCPFNEKQVLQHSLDAGGEPESLIYQWQWSESQDGPWYDYGPPNGPDGCTLGANCYADGVGLREVIIAGSSPFTLGDSWWRVRYRGYTNCPCAGQDCNQGLDSWPLFLADDNTRVSDWTDPQLAEGWIKRVLRGLNPFDQRIRDFHNVAVATYVSLIQQAGIRFEAPVALNCTPQNINNLDLIPAYETVLGRARLFSIEQGISYDPANLALMLISNQIAELYMLLGNEAFADATDPTIGFFGDTVPAQPTAAFSFEGQTANLLEEELALLRGKSAAANTILDADGFIIATPYNRLLWNFLPGTTPGRIAYANNYQYTTELEALDGVPQGHGDAWGHYLTTLKRYYRLLRHPVFDWINSTEFVLIAGQQPLEVTYQYERRFAKAAAAKARTGAAITSLTFRSRYSPDPEDQQGYPDPNANADRRWGLFDWGRRAGQGAYLDWLVVNALLDDEDDDPSHQNTLRQVDRTTVKEIGEIASAFSEIQSLINNADAGLNPLGLSPRVVPFGLDPGEIESGKTHFEQIYDRALRSVTNAVRTFNYANENTKRLRTVQDDSTAYTRSINESERDYTSSLIEIFGKPYPEDIQGNPCSGGPENCPPPTYAAEECPNGDCPDIFHFDYMDPGPLIGVTFHPETRTTVVATYLDKDYPLGDNRVVHYNISTNGFGLIKPGGWTERPEPGSIQQARIELSQSIGKYEKALADYQAHIDLIRCEADTLEELEGLNTELIAIKASQLAKETTLRAAILIFKEIELNFAQTKETIEGTKDAFLTALPTVIGAGTTVITDVAAPVRAVAATTSKVVKTVVSVAEKAFRFAGAAGLSTIEILRVGLDLRTLKVRTEYDEYIQESKLARAVKAEPGKRYELYVAGEALRQAIGKYQGAVGEGLRLLDARTAFREATARDVRVSRYQDAAYRIFRNEALQKFRAQFDMAAEYVFLAARAFDYETNLLTTDQDSGQRYLTNITRERSLGAFQCGLSGNCLPLAGSGLANVLFELSDAFADLKVRLGFNSASELERTFSLRWENFRIPDTSDQDDATWVGTLEGYIVPDINALPVYRVYAQPLQGGPAVNPGLVIPFDTHLYAGQNLFGFPSTGDETLPSDRFAIKVHQYGIRFEDYPGSPLNNQVNVYLIPTGADVVRSPVCPDAPIRQWNLIDQTLPLPQLLTASNAAVVLGQPDWMPWDLLSGGANALVKRRLIPTVAACDLDASGCDTSFKLTGRSIWNTQWTLIIPESELAGSPSVNGIDILIHGDASHPGIRDIKLVTKVYGYSGCAAAASDSGGAATGLTTEGSDLEATLVPGMSGN